MNRTILITASILGVLSIILGAFGAHALKKVLSTDLLQSFEVGVRCQMYHALLLLFLGTSTLFQTDQKKIIFYLILAGVIFFSGSIYALATSSISGINFKKIGFITPIGGLFLISGWIVMLVSFLRQTKF